MKLPPNIEQRIIDMFDLDIEESLKTCNKEKTFYQQTLKTAETALNVAQTKLDSTKETNDTLVIENASLLSLVEKLKQSLPGVVIPSQMQIYWDSKYPTLSNPIHVARPLPTNNAGNMMRVDVRDFCRFFPNPFIQQVATGGYGLNDGTDDMKALKCCAWVQDHFKYLSDKTQTGYNEYWFYPTESLELKKGDCEDGAILLYNIMRAAGIPAWKMRLTFGDVNYQGTPTGHVYLTYLFEDKNYWVLLDWCWYPNKKPVSQRPDYKKEAVYVSVLMSWNEDHAWSKNPISEVP